MAEPPSRITALIDKVVLYLKRNSADDYVVPKFVAKAVDESEISVITALRMLERRGITRQRFGVFCGSTSLPIESFDNLGDLPSQIYCQFCDNEHNQSDRSCKVEVYYTVDRRKLERMPGKEAAA